MNSIEGVLQKNCGRLMPDDDITCCSGGMRLMKRRKLISGNSLLVTYCSATKVKSHARTRKEHLFSETIKIFTRDR